MIQLPMSQRARNIISIIPNFPEEHFKQWWLQNYGTIGGSHVSVYIEHPSGYNKGKELQLKEVE